MSQHGTMQTFMKGASILTIAAILVKILSAIYRVPYQNLVGDQGFYIYQQVYPFIGIFIIWTSYGFAVAVSKLLADRQNPGEAKAIKRIAFIYLSILSLIFFSVLRGYAPFFAEAMGDPELVSLLRVSAYVVLVMPFLAVLKGSFQAYGQMIPVAVSSVGEQASRVLIVLIGTWLAITSGASLYKAGEIAMWGAVIGEVTGVFILAFYGRRTFGGHVVSIPIWATVKELTIISVSVSASSLILLFFQMVDSFTILNELLAVGMPEQQAMEIKGVYDRGQPLVQMGILIATTLALAIVPLIAHHASKEKGRGALPFIRVTYRTAFLFGWAATVGLILILPYINEMLFETREGSFTLMIFMLQVFWLSLLLPLTAILQGAGKVKVPTMLLGIGFVVKVIGNQLLVPPLGITGAAIASNIGFLLIVVSLLFYFKSVWKDMLAPVRFYGWIMVATVGMILVVVPWMFIGERLLLSGGSTRWAATVITLTAAILGALVFLLVVLKTRIIHEKEWYLLPFGKRLAKVQLWLRKR